MIRTSLDISQCIDDNPLAAIHLDNLRRTIRSAAMVDESRNATTLRSINDGIFINTEEITTPNPALQIPSLTHISNLLPDLLTHIFDNHIVRSDIFFSVQTPIVDCRTGKSHGLLAFLELVESQHIAFSVLGGQGLFLSVDIGN